MAEPTAVYPGLSEAEIETVEFFITLARALHVKRTVAEIYGLLFASPRPLPLDEFMTRLNLSKGSASMGLTYLRELGAIKPVFVLHDRRTHFEVVAELRRLAGEFLRVQIQPALEDGESRTQRILDAASRLPHEERAHIERRVATLRSWGGNTRRVLPLLLKALGK